MNKNIDIIIIIIIIITIIIIIIIIITILILPRIFLFLRTGLKFPNDRFIHVQFSNLIIWIPYDFLKFNFHNLLPKVGYLS